MLAAKRLDRVRRRRRRSGGRINTKVGGVFRRLLGPTDRPTVDAHTHSLNCVFLQLGTEKIRVRPFCVWATATADAQKGGGGVPEKKPSKVDYAKDGFSGISIFFSPPPLLRAEEDAQSL